MCGQKTHPYPRFCQWGPHGNVFSGADIWIPISGKKRFQFLQLLWGEMCPLSPLALVIDVIFVAFGFDVLCLIQLTVRVDGTLTGFKWSRIWNRRFKVMTAFIGENTTKNCVALQRELIIKKMTNDKTSWPWEEELCLANDLEPINISSVSVISLIGLS